MVESTHDIRERRDRSQLVEPMSSPKETHIRGPRGVELGRLVSLYGEPLINYCIDPVDVPIPKESDESLYDKGVPPFVVIGLGRCGCHVSAEFAEIVAANRPGGLPRPKAPNKGSWMSNFFGQHNGHPALQFEPIMLIGDIDETSFADVAGLMREGGVPEDIRRDFLKLHYQPLAEGGVGHVPVFAQFISRSLMLLPEMNPEGTSVWSPARRLLLNFQTQRRQVPRLVFYIFSAGGGTGAGSGAEIMRAQSYARTISNMDREMYFCGVSILPSSITRDQTQLINTGRTLVRYLADLNLCLDGIEAYDQAPVCQGSMYIEMPDASQAGDGDGEPGEKRPLMPWNSMAMISNDVMTTTVDQTLTFDEAEANANQYIAQQIFNLAAAQFPAAEFEKDKDGPAITKKNYQEIRLDPNDLKAGLIGPHAICFAAAPAEATNEQDILVIDEMFVRALSLPCQHMVEGSKGARLIEGVSVAPYAKAEYTRIVESLHAGLKAEGQGRLTEESFNELRAIPFFERCPRIVYSLTGAQKNNIPNSYRERLGELIHWAFPNLIQTRGAISWGTTSFFSLSIFVESSVLLAPDVQLALVNYLRLCWRQRRARPDGFVADYKRFIEQDPPVSDDEVKEWLGQTEQYGVSVANFAARSAEYDRKWTRFVERHCKEPRRKKALLSQRVENMLINHSEVAAALRYLNYANHLVKPEPIIDIGQLL